MAKYEFLFDAAFLLQAARKNWKQARTRYVLPVFKLIVGLILLASVVLTVAEQEYAATVFFAVLLAALSVSRWLDRWLIKRRFRKSPYRNDEVVITLTDEGVHTVDSKSETKWAWSACTKALRCPDGFLLYQGPGVFNWLPDTALIEGAIAEVESLLEANVDDYGST
jgi:FlaA1/EpsC-like NDP-sugar epimerase